MNDALGDRMKMYEGAESDRRFMPLLPVAARLDGRNFSSFTRGLERPYDVRLSRLMSELTAFLVAETVAVCGYTQSDEITLAWYSRDPKSQIYFDGRIQKMTSTLAATCSVAFNRLLAEHLPEKANESPTFDCRIWQLPTLDEATNVFLWRELDATKNSITMAAQSYYSHKELMNKNGSEKQEMLFRKGVNWNDYPAFFKRGSFVQRRTVCRKPTPEDMANLPEKHHARLNPELEFERSEYVRIEMPPLRQVANRVQVIFDGATPEVQK